MVSVMRKPDRSDNQPVSLPKNRVIPIDRANPPNPEKPSFVVNDPVTHRVIFAIGGRRQMGPFGHPGISLRGARRLPERSMGSVAADYRTSRSQT
jgi:hypothetical protein